MYIALKAIVRKPLLVAADMLNIIHAWLPTCKKYEEYACLRPKNATCKGSKIIHAYIVLTGSCNIKVTWLNERKETYRSINSVQFIETKFKINT